MSDNLPKVHPSEYTDSLEAPSVEKAVSVSQTPEGQTFIVGDERKEEWVTTADMGPLDVEEYR